MEERFLKCWIDMEVRIRANRIVSNMSFNEMVVCAHAKRAEDNGVELAAVDLCESLRLLKSQMNKVVMGLVGKGYIERIRSTKDARKLIIRLTEEGQKAYLEEHEHVLELVRTIRQDMGDEDLNKLTELLARATESADSYQKQN